MIDALARYGGLNCIFRHDNAAMHSSKSTKKYLLHNNVVTMTWPANSPDLNPLEKVWLAMARIVYAYNRSFTTIATLKIAINAAWEEISIPLLSNLLNSMPDRMYEVILNQGGHTHY
jgi:transposase